MLKLPPKGLPLLLCGPILRRVDKTSVSVFVVLKNKWNVTLTLYKYEGNKFNEIFKTKRPILPKTLGIRFHPAVITLEVPAGLLSEGEIYGYNLSFSNPKNPSEKSDLKSLSLLRGSIDLSKEDNKEYPSTIPFPSLSYTENAYPTFMLPPKGLKNLRLSHGSCRLPHNPRPDALPALDEILDLEWKVSNTRYKKTWELPGRRPHKLFLTGDQIYADDVAPAMLYVAGQVGFYLLGWEEPIPGIKDSAVTTFDFSLLPNRRHSILADQAKFTSGNQASHLISFAEYIGMYVMVWSDVFWRREFISNKLIEITADEVFGSKSYPWKGKELEKELLEAKKVFHATHKTILKFSQSIPYVRRALANIPTYMIFDDHDVTDDWNLNGDWIFGVTNSSLGKRIIQNALSAYTIFQAWGNNPKEFSSTVVGGDKILKALEVWRGESDQSHELQANLELVKWDWAYKDESLDYQFIALDTRTKRYYETLEGKGAFAPGLIRLDELKRQITDRLDKPKIFSATFIISPPPIFGSTFADGWVKSKIVQKVKSTSDVLRYFSKSLAKSILPSLPSKIDNEAWEFHPYYHEELLRVLAPFRRVFIMSGDVHYGYTASVDYWDQRDNKSLGLTAKFIQCTSSSLKKEDMLTRLLGVDTYKERERALDMIPGVLGSAGKPSVRSAWQALSIAGYLYALEKLEHPDVAYLGWVSPGLHVKNQNGKKEYVGPKKGTQSGEHELPALLTVPLDPNYSFINQPSWRYRIKFIWDGEHRIEYEKERYKGKGIDGMRKQAGDHRRLLRHDSMRRIVGNNNIAMISFRIGSPKLFLQQDFWFRLDQPPLDIFNSTMVDARIDQKALDRLALPYTSHKKPIDTAIEPPDEDSRQPRLGTY